MKRHIFATTLLLALAACGQANAPHPKPSAEGAANELALTCAGFAGLTPASLAERYGAENVTTQTMPGPEGESYEATLVYAGDAARRLEVVWNEANTAPASITVGSIGTQWRGAEGYTIGTPIAEVERMNVMPFKLWGFDWDYGGWVSDWSVGALSATNVPGCVVRMRFDPRSQTNTSSASGDNEFMSNDPGVRAADPAVGAFGLMFGAPNAE